MGKSLTEVAKAILMNESNDSAPDAGAKSSNPNMATLRPGGGNKGGVEPSPMSNEAELVGDAPKSPGQGDNVGAKAAKMKQDSSQASPSRKGAVPAMKPETMEEDVEEDADMIEEGKKEDREEAEEAMKGKDVKKLPAGKAKGLGPEKYRGGTFKIGAKAANLGMGNKKLEEEIEDSADILVSEELQEFIDAMIEEGYDEDQIVAAIEENFDFVAEETEEAPVEYDYEVDMNEDIEALFAGEELSEEFMEKAKTIFEAAVKAKMQSEIARLEEAYANTLEEEVETIKEELSSNVDDYLNYVVEQWVSDNEVAIEAGLRTELTEDFISGLRQLFAENYIDIPEDKISVVEEFGNKIEELEAKLNEEIERNVELTNILSESKKTEIMYSMVEGLTATQAEKLKELSENVEFVDVESYLKKIQTLRESYFPSSVKAQSELDRIESGTEGQTMIAEENNPMSKYVRALGKSLPN
jgi:hypothetical protein